MTLQKMRLARLSAKRAKKIQTMITCCCATAAIGATTSTASGRNSRSYQRASGTAQSAVREAGAPSASGRRRCGGTLYCECKRLLSNRLPPYGTHELSQGRTRAASDSGSDSSEDLESLTEFFDDSGSEAEEGGSEESDAQVGLYPIVTLQYSSTTLYQVYYHIQ
jgi:hypothetical protein